MNNKIFVFIIISFFLTSQLVYANDSRYSQSLSRMEREWLHKEFNTDSDEERITRLEEKVFGTIHDVNIQTRYKQLRRCAKRNTTKTSLVQRSYERNTNQRSYEYWWSCWWIILYKFIVRKNLCVSKNHYNINYLSVLLVVVNGVLLFSDVIHIN